MQYVFRACKGGLISLLNFFVLCWGGCLYRNKSELLLEIINRRPPLTRVTWLVKACLLNECVSSVFLQCVWVYLRSVNVNCLLNFICCIAEQWLEV